MPLRAGAARVCITPPLGSGLQGSFNARYATNIHDDLYAQAIVLDNGGQRVGFVVCDLIALIDEQVGPAKALVAERCGIPPEHLIVSATHTHTGPVTMLIAENSPEAAYLAELPGKIADAVALAVNRLEPAELGFGTGSVPSVVFNRRWHMKDGTVRFNPGYQHPDLVEPAGPTDPTLSVMVLRTPERKPLAVLTNLALHYVGSSGLDISADYYGFFRTALQRCAGAEFLVAMSNGCEGDINNCDFSRAAPRADHAYFHAERVANHIAGEAWKVWNGLWEEDFTDDVALGGALEWVTMHPRRPSPEEIAEGKAWMAEHKPEDDLWKWTYASEHVAMEHGWPETEQHPVQTLRVGDIAFVGIPAEPFCEIGLELREKSLFPHCVPIGLANDCAGYVATDRHHDLGGYEVMLCRWAYAPKGTVQGWIAAALREMEALKGVAQPVT